MLCTHAHWHINAHCTSTVSLQCLIKGQFVSNELLYLHNQRCPCIARRWTTVLRAHACTCREREGGKGGGDSPVDPVFHPDQVRLGHYERGFRNAEDKKTKE